MQSLYRLQIIDHYKHPRNFRLLESPQAQHTQANSYCGDEVTVTLSIDNDRIIDVGFTGTGCALSLAGASLLLEKIKGMPVSEVLSWSEEDQLALVGVEKTTGRRACIILSQQAIHQALRIWKQKS